MGVMMDSINTDLLDAIAEDGRTQDEIAREAGIQPSTLSRIVNGQPCRHRTAYQVAKALGKTIDDLFLPRSVRLVRSVRKKLKTENC